MGMDRRLFLRRAGAGMALAAFSGGAWGVEAVREARSAGAAGGGPRRPDVVIVVADDLGWNDVGYHGSEIKTPNIDRFAGESVELNRYYVCPVCSPTRASLMSGRHPLRYGMQGGVCNPYTNHGMPPEERTIAEMLAGAGYAERAMVGKWHLGLSSEVFHPLRQGFTYFYGHLNGALDYFTHSRAGELDWHEGWEANRDEGYSTNLLGQAAVEFVERAAGKASPFFLYLCFNAPHSPMQAEEDDLALYGYEPDKEMGVPRPNVGKKEGQPDWGARGRGNSLRQTYAAMVTSMDEQFGRVLAALEKAGVAEDTLVLFHSDNGGTAQFGGNNEPLRGGKGTVWEGGVRVAAAVRWPGRFPQRKLEMPVHCVDVWPTLAELVGQAEGHRDYELDGDSVLAVLTGESAGDADRKVFVGGGATTGAVTKRWKLVGEELCDLENDPYETRDVGGRHGRVLAEMKAFRDGVVAKRGPQFTVGPKKEQDWRPPKDWDTRTKK